MCPLALAGVGEHPGSLDEVTKSGLLPLAFTLHVSLVMPGQLRSNCVSLLGVFVSWAFRLLIWDCFGSLTETRMLREICVWQRSTHLRFCFHAVNPALKVFPRYVIQPVLNIRTAGPVIRVLPLSSHLEIDCLKTAASTLAFRDAPSFQTCCHCKYECKAS